MTARHPIPKAPTLTTRVLLLCAVLAAVQVIVYLITTSTITSMAAVAPPLYALIAGLHSVMPFLARILTGTPWTATITAGIAGVLIWPFSAVGLLVIFVFLAGAVTFDLMVLRRGRHSRGRLIGAACIVAVVLFLVSLPVFSADHLTPFMLVAALAGRLIGELLALVCAGVLAGTLHRIGVGGASL